jgi:tRNA A-37 threonylcarbamoyl transferase component Bud32
MADLSGQYLGRYYLSERLGEGGMAVVYKAYDTRLERDVAIKIIRSAAFHEEELGQVLKRFEREAKSLAKLSHPNIVKVHDYGEHDGSPYLVMEFLPGGTLKKLLGKPIPWQEAVRLLLPVARGVAYAHQHGILHRDIKPANVLITDSGEPMLSDFGIAKLFESGETTALTGSGMAIGTPEYMAPEQWNGMTSPQSDLYSLGIMFYEMVAGRKPYIADTPAAILIKQATEPLPLPRQFAVDLPAPVEAILIKALAKDPKDRYPDVNAFVAALGNLTTTVSVVRATEVPVEKSVPPVPMESGYMASTRVVQPEARVQAPATQKGAVRVDQVQQLRSRTWIWLAAGATIIILLVIAGIALLPRLFVPRPGLVPAENTGAPLVPPPSTPTAMPPSPTPRPASTNTPVPTATPELLLCFQAVSSTAAAVKVELNIGADTTDSPLILTLGRKGDGWSFVGDSYSCRINQPGDLKPDQNNVFTFEVPLKFCDMTMLELGFTDGGKDRAEFKGFTLSIDNVSVWGDRSMADQPEMINFRNIMGGWEGVASYKARCTP